MAECSLENVKLLYFALGVMSSFKNHSGKIAVLAAEDGTLYQDSMSGLHNTEILVRRV